MSIELVSLILGALIVFYFYLTRNYNHWQKHGVPCVDGPLPGFGHMMSMTFLKTHIVDFYGKIYKNNKGRSMIGFYNFTTPSLIILEPELVKTVMQTNFSNFSENAFFIDPKLDPLLSHNPVFSSGEKWLNSRKRLTYAFSNVRLQILLESVKKVCVMFENYIAKELSSNVGKAEFELKELFTRYTAQAVAAVGFGVDGYSFDDEKNDISFKQLGKTMFEPSLQNKISFILVTFVPSLRKIFKRGFIPKHINRFFQKLVADLFEQRRKDKIPRNDFIQLMSELTQAEGIDIDTDVLAAYALSFLIDGYETAGSTMSYVGFHLASNPKIQEKLREEVMSVLKKHNNELTYEGLKEMTYMEQVINESLRMITIIVVMFKRCTQEFELKGSDGVVYHVKPGTELVIPVQALHKDPQYWEDPEKYDPERFNPEKKQSIERFAYLPFGEGPRMCVGMRMAIVQMKAGLATILKQYRIELSPKTQLPIEMIPGTVSQTPKGGFWVYLRQL